MDAALARIATANSLQELVEDTGEARARSA